MPSKRVPLRDGFIRQLPRQLAGAALGQLEGAELREALMAAQRLGKRRPEMAAELTARIGGEIVQVRLAPQIIGLGLSVFASRFVATLLFGVQSYDPVTLVGTLILLAAIAAVAGSLPAQRAARLDPAQVLKEI